MKKFLFVICLLTIASCNFQEKKQETAIPFKNLELTRIYLNDPKEHGGISDSLGLREVNNYLSQLASEDLIKGKRLHGAETLCSIKIEGQKNNFIVVIKNHDKDGVTASFLEENAEDNFSYSLGRLYNAEDFVQLLKKHGLYCTKKE